MVWKKGSMSLMYVSPRQLRIISFTPEKRVIELIVDFRSFAPGMESVTNFLSI